MDEPKLCAGNWMRIGPELPLEPYQLILPIGAWNIRERDEGGQSEARRRQGREPERWHWVYTGTCFRLDQRAQTAGGRPVIVERGFDATREGLDALREQLHAEARRRGLGQAAGVLVIAEGTGWIWRLADDRLPDARKDQTPVRRLVDGRPGRTRAFSPRIV